MINLDTTIVNVALPTLVRELDAIDQPAAMDRRRVQPGRSRRLLLAAGSLCDRVGRKGMLLAGLGVFGIASVDRWAGDERRTQLIVARASWASAPR